MQPQRGTTTEHLADIIEILRIGNKSGTLMIERGEGRMREEGSIIFIGGQAVEARVNQQSGSAAFNYLSTWQRCHFSFVSDTHTESSSSFSRLPSGPLNNNATAVPIPSKPGAGQQSGFYERSESAKPSSPQRLLRGEEVLQYRDNTQLPRIHRRLLLLIDGKRSTSELARLMARDANEVLKILEDLEHAGLIRQ